MEKGLLDKTGKPLSYWVKLIRKEKFSKHSEILNFLKNEHGFTHGFANFVAHKTRESDAGSHDAKDLIRLQYSKDKMHLKPIYEKLAKLVSSLGKDVEIVPKKANVSIKARRQFLLIQPSTKTRIDLGLKFNQKPTGKRLKDSGSFGSMCTHSVQVTSLREVDKELIGWINEAYKEAQ